MRSDTRNGQAPWKVIGESAAGASLGKALKAGEAARIFTGATMPEGADCVLVQEEAGRDGDVLAMTGDGPAQVGAHSPLSRRGF